MSDEEANKVRGIVMLCHLMSEAASLDRVRLFEAKVPGAPDPKALPSFESFEQLDTRMKAANEWFRDHGSLYESVKADLRRIGTDALAAGGPKYLHGLFETADNMLRHESRQLENAWMGLADIYP